MIKLGILNLQGDVSEHRDMTKEALKNLNIESEVSTVKTAREVALCQGIIISGGESTVIGKLIIETGIKDTIIQNQIPVFGTCAGMVLLSKETDYDQPLLGLMDMKVKRNAFGRQRDSFEQEIEVLGEKYPGVFIRAPSVEEVSGEAQIISEINENIDGKTYKKIIGVKQGKNIALAFHPELTGDTRLHEYFIKEVL